MRQNFKKLTAILLSLAMLAGSFAALVINVSATDEKAGLQKGEFVFAPHTYTEGDLTDIYYYTDELFAGSALDYNEHLATMSMIMAAASISSQEPDAGYAIKSQNLLNLFRDLDFSSFEVNNYYTERPGEQTMGVDAAYKVIGEGENAYTVLAIIPRSAGYQREWAGNFTVGKEGLHQGFATGRDIILDFAKSYVENNKSDFVGPVKIWTVGYSRGAGVANLLGAYLDDNSSCLGIEVKKENIFAYTFGTPSNVQFANEEEKAALESNYKNIYNHYSEYDIVTYAPFKNWNFTYYGSTKLFDVQNAEKKAEMLKFLEKTNETIYTLYTAENSSADPDNFMPLMLQLNLSEGFHASMVPADPAYGIPTNQKDFLESRITFLVENLVPDRATYVDGGYEYALQRLTSLYFGLNAEQSSLLFGGMSHEAPILAAAYYAYFLSDFYLKTDAAVGTVSALIETLLTVEGYITAALQSGEYANEEWFLYAQAFLQSEKYLTVKATLGAAAADPAILVASMELITEPIRNFAVGMTAKVLGSGVSALTIDETEKAELLATMTAPEVAAPLTRFLVYLLLGSEDATVNAFNPGNKNIALAVTFLANAGRYMRVHNNEIILSWLRTEDSYYANEDWHIHDISIHYDATGHWDECACGYKDDTYHHAFSDWSTEPVTVDGKEVLVRRCPCGYEEHKDAPAEGSKFGTLTIVLICVSAAVAIAVVTVTVVVVVKKKKSTKEES